MLLSFSLHNYINMILYILLFWGGLWKVFIMINAKNYYLI